MTFLSAAKSYANEFNRFLAQPRSFAAEAAFACGQGVVIALPTRNVNLILISTVYHVATFIITKLTASFCDFRRREAIHDFPFYFLVKCVSMCCEFLLFRKYQIIAEIGMFVLIGRLAYYGFGILPLEKTVNDDNIMQKIRDFASSNEDNDNTRKEIKNLTTGMSLFDRFTQPERDKVVNFLVSMPRKHMPFFLEHPQYVVDIVVKLPEVVLEALTDSRYNILENTGLHGILLDLKEGVLSPDMCYPAIEFFMKIKVKAKDKYDRDFSNFLTNLRINLKHIPQEEQLGIFNKTVDLLKKLGVVERGEFHFIHSFLGRLCEWPGSAEEKLLYIDKFFDLMSKVKLEAERHDAHAVGTILSIMKSDLGRMSTHAKREAYFFAIKNLEELVCPHDRFNRFIINIFRDKKYSSALEWINLDISLEMRQQISLEAQNQLYPSALYRDINGVVSVLSSIEANLRQTT